MLMGRRSLCFRPNNVRIFTLSVCKYHRDRRRRINSNLYRFFVPIDRIYTYIKGLGNFTNWRSITQSGRNQFRLYSINIPRAAEFNSALQSRLTARACAFLNQLALKLSDAGHHSKNHFSGGCPCIKPWFFQRLKTSSALLKFSDQC